jgi:hypothetical protein
MDTDRTRMITLLAGLEAAIPGPFFAVWGDGPEYQGPGGIRWLQPVRVRAAASGIAEQDAPAFAAVMGEALRLEQQDVVTPRPELVAVLGDRPWLVIEVSPFVDQDFLLSGSVSRLGGLALLLQAAARIGQRPAQRFELLQA